MTTNGPDLHRTKSLDVGIVPPTQNGDLSSPINDANHVPTLKEVIKLEDKLISGEEIEIYPNFHVDNRRSTKCLPKDADAHLASANSIQRKNPKNESSKSCLKSDKSDKTSSDKSPITIENYPKLYITVANTSDQNAMSKNMLLKSISGIQSSDGDSYGINISNSRFFVPKNYIFSGVECSMDDLKFEVDPEMGKLLQRSYSNPQVNTGSPTLIDVETNRASLNAATATRRMETLFDKTMSIDSIRQREDPKCLRAHSDTSLADLKSRESVKAERKQRLFLKKRDSKPSREIVDSLLDGRTHRSKASVVSRASRSNRAESLNRLHNRDSVPKSEKESRGMKYTTSIRELVATAEKPHNLKIEAAEEKTPQSNQLWIPKHTIIDDCEIVKKRPAADAITIDDKKSLGTLEGSEKASSPDKNIESDITSPMLDKNMDTALDEVSTSRDCPDTPSTRQNQKKRDGSSTYNEQQQKLKYSNLSETNRANRIKFLQDSLRTGVSEYDKFTYDFRVEKVNPPGNKLSVTNEEPKAPRNTVNPPGSVGKDQDSPFRRTSSLREKYETIMEDVELRTAPGRRLHVPISCGRKSLAHLSVLWEPRPLQVHRSKRPNHFVRPGKQCRAQCRSARR